MSLLRENPLSQRQKEREQEENRRLVNNRLEALRAHLKWLEQEGLEQEELEQEDEKLELETEGAEETERQRPGTLMRWRFLKAPERGLFFALSACYLSRFKPIFPENLFSLSPKKVGKEISKRGEMCFNGGLMTNKGEESWLTVFTSSDVSRRGAAFKVAP